ncbi:MAG: urate hydroxylase PuuD [Acidobacteriota bacterium]
MNAYVSEWLNLTLRWIHVLAGILWVGQTYFFSWLDSRMSASTGPSAEEKVAGGVWMVHSGGFYLVKKPEALEQLPRNLHWFRWEAAITWISGFLLLGIVYYMGGILVVPASGISIAAGTGIGLGVLLLGWLIYDLLWSSPLGKNELLGGTISFALVVGTAYSLTQVLSGRAAFIHIGAIFGTIMAANVWIRILPAQRQMVAAAKEGKRLDPALAAQAKQRSKHNTYMTVPLVFIMVSNHFPTASYGHHLNWLMLAAFVLVGWAARKVMIVMGR